MYFHDRKDDGPVLKTGSHILAKIEEHGWEQEYEFVGFAPFERSGCAYLILRNIESGVTIGVEHNWFNEALTGRKIELLKNG